MTKYDRTVSLKTSRGFVIDMVIENQETVEQSIEKFLSYMPTLRKEIKHLFVTKEIKSDLAKKEKSKLNQMHDFELENLMEDKDENIIIETGD